MTSTTPNPTEILLTPLGTNDAGASTIGQYLAILNEKLWHDEDQFSGKHPFGNSDWKGPIIKALILHEHIDGKFDEEGDIEDYDPSELETAMLGVFNLLRNADYRTLQLPPPPKEFYLLEFDTNGDMVDYEGNAYSREEAVHRFNTLYTGEDDRGWRVVHIPTSV